MTKLEDSVNIVKQLQLLLERQRNNWLKYNDTYKGNDLYRDSTPVVHMLSALADNLNTLIDGEKI